MILVGEINVKLYIALGDMSKSKLILEYFIIEIKRLDTSLRMRKQATLQLAECYSDLGNLQKAEDLLKVIFKAEYPKLAAASSTMLENYCHSCRVVRLAGAFGDANCNLQDYKNMWEDDEDEINFLVDAARLIRKIIPCTLMEVSDDNFAISLPTQLVSVAALLRRHSPSPYPLLRLLSHVPALAYSN
jgi:hypothetical protein